MARRRSSQSRRSCLASNHKTKAAPAGLLMRTTMNSCRSIKTCGGDSGVRPGAAARAASFECCGACTTAAPRSHPCHPAVCCYFTLVHARGHRLLQLLPQLPSVRWRGGCAQGPVRPAAPQLSRLRAFPRADRCLQRLQRPVVPSAGASGHRAAEVIAVGPTRPGAPSHPCFACQRARWPCRKPNSQERMRAAG